MATNVTRTMDALDRRIVAALQVNGRAGWRKIGTVLDVPERTVTARATELLQDGLVRVTALTLLPRGGVPVSGIVALHCVAGMQRVAAASVAARPDVTFTYITSGCTDGVFEFLSSESRSATLLLDELPGTPGVSTIETSTVIRHYRAAHQWLPGILDPDQVAALTDPERSVEPTGAIELPALSRDEVVIARALAADGRATIEELARVAGLSAASARRRLAGLGERGRLVLRAVVDPRIIGFPVESVLWIRTIPGRIDVVAANLLAASEVRYLAFVTGRYQFVANVAFASHEELGAFLSRSAWTEHVAEVDTSMVLAAIKRSGLRFDAEHTSVDPD